MTEKAITPLTISEARLVARQIKERGGDQYWAWVIETLCNRVIDLEGRAYIEYECNTANGKLEQIKLINP